MEDEDAHRSASAYGVSTPEPLLGFSRMSERQLYRLRAPSSGRELLLARRARQGLHGPRHGRDRSRWWGRCSRCTRRSPACHGRSRRCASATGAISPPRRTSTTARRAAAGWPRCPAERRSHAPRAAARRTRHRARTRRRRLRRRNQVTVQEVPGDPAAADRARRRRGARPRRRPPTPTPTATRQPTPTPAPQRPRPTPEATGEAPADTGTHRRHRRRRHRGAGRRGRGDDRRSRRPRAPNAEEFEDFCATNPGAC